MNFARRELARIAALEATGFLKPIIGYGQLSPVERLALARGERK